MASLHFQVRLRHVAPYASAADSTSSPARSVDRLPTDYSPISMLQLKYHRAARLSTPVRMTAPAVPAISSSVALRMPFPQRPYLVKDLLGPAHKFCLRLFPFQRASPLLYSSQFPSLSPFIHTKIWDALLQGKRPSALSKWAALFAPAQHDCQSIAITLCPLYLQNIQITVYAQSIQFTVRMTPPQCRHSRLALVHPRIRERLRLRPGFRTACRRCEGARRSGVTV